MEHLGSNLKTCNLLFSSRNRLSQRLLAANMCVNCELVEVVTPDPKSKRCSKTIVDTKGGVAYFYFAEASFIN